MLLRNKLLSYLVIGLLSMIITGNSVSAQTDSLEEDTTVYVVVEKMPYYEAGQTAFYKIISDSITYDCFRFNKEESISSKVYIEFILTKNGDIKDIKAVHNKSVNECFTKEMETILNKCGPWIPGEQNGKKVNVLMMIPVIIEFR